MDKIPNDKLRIVFLLLPHCNMLDFAGASQVFLEAIEHGLNAEISYCSYEGNLQTASGLPLGNVGSYKKEVLKKDDYVFIVSAHISYTFSSKLNPEKELTDWLIKSHKSGVVICAFCIGAFLLGKTGLLDERNCTTHWKRTDQLQKKYPFARVQENTLFIEDNGVITSAGATSGVDVALHVLSKLKDDSFAYKISRELVVYNRRSGSSAQQSVFMNYRNHVHGGVHKVQDWLQGHLEKKTSIPYLAEIAGMSERNFTRIFKKETNLTVNDYITLLRKEKIKELMKNPDLSRDQIAKECGLQSVRHLNRLIHLN